jgi:2-oxo-hept-3-ene-1,7-dioate hydratase
VRDPQTHCALALTLHEAERSGVQIEQFSKLHPGMCIADRYAIQREWVRMKVAEGRVVKGHKIGLTSRAMQIASQITEPGHGVLLDDMFFRDGSDIPASRFILPRVEVELAFILKTPLRGAQVTLFDVLNAVDCVEPALEIIDARIEQLDRVSKAPCKVFDTIAGNAASAGIVMGGRLQTRCPPPALPFPHGPR